MEQKEIQPSWLMIGIGCLIAFAVFWGGFQLLNLLFFEVLAPFIPETSWGQLLIALIFTCIIVSWIFLCVSFAKYLATKGTQLHCKKS